jgi:hypothetical protein
MPDLTMVPVVIFAPQHPANLRGAIGTDQARAVF